MSKHTPGPWTLDRDKGTRRVIRSEGAKPRTVAIVDSWTIEADARLIAAAPDLLAALQGFASWLELQPDNYQEAFASRLRVAHAAIAKATK